MCCLFGLIDYRNTLSRREKEKILSVLSVACEARGTDATGIAYNLRHAMHVYKRPLPAHKMRFYLPVGVNVVMGHTRMTTQGAESRNFNNHPFYGSAGDTPFALAHNGVLQNDLVLRETEHLPETNVETDSYVAVQLLEQAGELSFSSLQHMAEKLQGSFTLTVLSDKNDVYFIKGDNPMCLYHWEQKGLYLYASTEEILKAALKKLPMRLGKPKKVRLYCGQILRIDAEGHQSYHSFDDSRIYDSWFYPTSRSSVWLPSASWPEAPEKDSYVDDLKSVAGYYGYGADQVDQFLSDGYSPSEIEDLMYCGYF